MRTALAIDDDVLAAARALADQHRRTLGEVVSELARQFLSRLIARAERNCIPLLPMTNPKAQVTLDIANRLRDESP